MRFMKRIFIQLLAGLLIVSAGVACSSEDEFGQGTARNEQGQTEEFRVLSVTSSGEGEEVRLSLDVHVEETGDLRTRIFNENGIGEISKTAVGDTEQVYLILRRKGDPAATTYIKVEIAGRNGQELRFEDLKLNLPSGINIGSADEWYITGVLGGDSFDMTNGVLSMGNNPLATAPLLLPTRSDRSVEVPFAFPWSKLSVVNTKTLSVSKSDQVTFKPLGTLLRLNFYSNLLDDFRASKLNIRTNALRSVGTFDLMSYADDDLLGKLPVWTPAEQEASPSIKAWSYKLADGDGASQQTLLLPAGAGHATERTIYIWGMPTDVEAANTSTTISLDVRKASSASTDVSEMITYDKQAHRPLKNGSYRLSNILNSDLIISEVYYQLVPPRTNGEQANENRNYSIVEIYNPTASEVDLTEYSLIRTLHYNNRQTYFIAGKLPDGVLNNATTQPLSDVARANATDGSFRLIYGTASTKLGPGKTILIGAGGYVARPHKPGKNIELYNAASQPTDPTAVRDIEKKYYPRAGMQIDSAFQRGYVDKMVALDNGTYKDRHSGHGTGAGILQLGNGQGIAIVKTVAGVRTIVDITTPMGEVSAYRTQLLSQINAVVPATERLSRVHHEDAMSYSIVRKAWVGAPSATYKAEEWEVAASENDGVKSLGTRSYVAGLTPYAQNYSGYTSANNPKGNPFWASVGNFSTITKDWDTLPSSGENVTIASTQDYLTDRYEEVPVSSGSASQNAVRTTSSGMEFEKSYDGSYTTHYHSNDSGAGGARLPADLRWNLAEPAKLEYMLFTPHNQQGSFNQFDVYFTYEDDTEAKVYTNNSFGTPTAPTQIRWDGINSRKVKSVRFHVRQTGNGVLAVKEMEFFKQKDSYFDPTPYFTDLSCSELKPSVTYAQIMAVENVFYRELMRKLYQKSYDTEFRVTTRPVLVSPHVEKAYNKTQMSYSRYNGATGIYVKQGEDVVIFIDKVGSERPIILVQDLYNVGYGGTEIRLEPGLNKFKADRSGLLYIIYSQANRTLDRTAYPDIKFHFASGTVNGYFDATNPKHQGRWKELLSKATSPIFDIVGQYAHVSMLTDMYRRYTPDGAELLEHYDRVVYEEQRLQGMVKYNRMFTNRAYFMYDRGGGMWATEYRTGYRAAEPLYNVHGADGFKLWNWGAGHEQGHQNQTIGLNWGGMIEVTVNIPALYIEESIFGTDSRSIRGNWYTNAWNDLLRGNASFTTKSQASSSLIAFWQLELYFGRVLGRTPLRQADNGGFYPDLYQRLREYPTPQPNNAENNGIQQTNFAWHASVVSGYDLTDFFEKWGFFRTTNNEEHRNTYNHANYLTVTDAMVADVKAKIQAIPNKKQLTVALEYITSENWEMYKNPQPVVSGTSARSDRTFSFVGWRNVVAWEVRDASGTLLYTSAGRTAKGATSNTFTLDRAWSDSYVVNAIAADGTRTRVTF